MIWADEEEEVATWEDISFYYKAWLKSVTCSEIDYPDRPSFYVNTNPAANGQEEEIPSPGLDFAPLIFQSLYYINSRKGGTCVEFFFTLILGPS